MDGGLGANCENCALGAVGWRRHYTAVRGAIEGQCICIGRGGDDREYERGEVHDVCWMLCIQR